MNNKWVSYLPHLKSNTSTTKIYLFMMILLCPVIGVAAITLDLYPLLTVLVAVLSAWVADIVFKLIVERKYNFSDVSSIFIGLVIGVLMPTGAYAWVPIIPTIVAITFIRNIAGGVGQNFVSEIAVSVVLAALMFPAEFGLYETAAGGVLKQGFAETVLAGGIKNIDLEALLFGGIGGTIADSALLWVIIAGVILMVSRVVDFKIPLLVIASTFGFTALLLDVVTAVNLTLGGGVIMVALFVATDYAVVPKNIISKIVYGVLFGFITAVLWRFTLNPLGVYYSAIIMGLIGCVMNGIALNYKRRRV